MSTPEKVALLFFVELMRASTAVGLLHIPGFRQIPASTRAFLGFLLAILCLAAKWGQPGLVAPARGDLWVICAKNLVAGLFVALLWNIVLDACALTIQIASVQSGLSYASVIDPTNDTESGSLLAATQFSILLTFVAAGLHLEFLRLLLDSDALWPKLTNAATIAGMLKVILGQSFLIGIRLAAPFMAILILLDVASAIGGRFAERFQLSMLAFPVKWTVTLLILLASAATFQQLEVRLAIGALSLAEGR
ncbi:flagellar biosynthetic protein FliR [Bryobacter aggregatus]|uniref:flagellar biosynthetic protein FliR n=1 Tax=Bryobacter aggregatus TaxID=360054 RepID=UPI00056A5126|nr:flagellar biosynthetic protein FliR [Bryobacter aggregatus]